MNSNLKYSGSFFTDNYCGFTHAILALLELTHDMVGGSMQKPSSSEGRPKSCFSNEGQEKVI
jgi:hypothetical protein